MESRRRRAAPRRRTPALPGRRTAALIGGAATVVAALVFAACSSNSGSGHGSSAAPSDSGSASASASGPAGSSGTPTASGTGTGTASGTAGPSGSGTPADGSGGAAKYATLPPPCKAVTAATVSALVPKAKSPAGTADKSGDLQTRGGCSWTGNGTDGYQYRWLSVTLQRYPDDPQLGAGDDQARKRYTQQLQDLRKAGTTGVVTGLGDEASQVSGWETVAKVTSQNDTVVAVSGNVVVLVEYDGAGLEGKKNPSRSVVQSGAQRAAKDALAAVAAANT